MLTPKRVINNSVDKHALEDLWRSGFLVRYSDMFVKLGV